MNFIEMDADDNLSSVSASLYANVTATAITGNEDGYKRDAAVVTAEIAIQGIIFVLAVIGNGLVILILLMSSKRKKKLSRMNTLILHLSIADLFVAFFNVLPQLIWDITLFFYGGDFLCRAVKYLQVVAMYASSYVLIVTALDRYIALCHPLLSQRWSNGRVHIMAAIAWFIALIFSIPQVVFFAHREIPDMPGKYNCWAVFDPMWTLPLYITFVTIAIYIIPTIILMFAYGKICYVVWMTSSKQETSYKKKCGNTLTPNGNNQNSSGKGKNNNRMGSTVEVQVLVTPRSHGKSLHRSKVKTIKLTLVVIICYFICWSPFFICQMWSAWDENAPFQGTGMVIVMLLASLNSCTNPWIYLAFTDNLRHHLSAMFPGTRRDTNAARSMDSRLGSTMYSNYSRTEMSKVESVCDRDNTIPLVKL